MPGGRERKSLGLRNVSRIFDDQYTREAMLYHALYDALDVKNQELLRGARISAGAYLEV